MSELIDNVARILATPMPRRKALKLFGGAFAAAAVAFAGGQPLKAAPAATTKCGKGTCTGNKCCATTSKTAAAVCCNPGFCVCNNACTPSTGGVCPSSCSVCNA